jgi:ribosomal protein S18 acetylase RimI-like enzyme
MSEIILLEHPKERTYYSECAAVFLRAFSDGGFLRFISKTPEDAVTDRDPLDPKRHKFQSKQLLHRALKPRGLLVCAIKDGKVVGYAWWDLPASLARKETIWQKIYRKTIEFKDQFNGKFFPPEWRDNGRFHAFWRAEAECEKKYLGSDIDRAWYLDTLAVLPEYQRQGIGKMLVDYGLHRAQERGEKAYTQASEFGKGLYLQKGFKIVGDQVNSHGGVTYRNPFMVWEPKSE